MQQADTLQANGQPREALADYTQALAELQKLQKVFPYWEPEIVTYRLNYLTDKINGLAAQLPPLPQNGVAPATNAVPAGASAAELAAQLNVYVHVSSSPAPVTWPFTTPSRPSSMPNRSTWNGSIWPPAGTKGQPITSTAPWTARSSTAFWMRCWWPKPPRREIGKNWSTSHPMRQLQAHGDPGTSRAVYPSRCWPGEQYVFFFIAAVAGAFTYC